jgi:hypothetical protein
MTHLVGETASRVERRGRRNEEFGEFHPFGRRGCGGLPLGHRNAGADDSRLVRRDRPERHPARGDARHDSGAQPDPQRRRRAVRREIAGLAETAAKQAGQSPWSIRIRHEPSTAIRQIAKTHGLPNAVRQPFMARGRVTDIAPKVRSPIDVLAFAFVNTKSQGIKQRTGAAVEGLVAGQARIATVAPDAYERSWDHGVREIVLGAPYSALNVLFCTAAEVDLDVLAAGADHLEGAGVPWSIRVRASAADAVTELAAGYGRTNRLTMPVMAKQLDRSDAAPVPGARRVSGDDSASYLRTLAEGFECPPALFGRLCESAVLDQRLMRAFLVETRGFPVATALGVQAGDIAAVFNIGVPPTATVGRDLPEVLVCRVPAADAGDDIPSPLRPAAATPAAVPFRTVRRLGCVPMTPHLDLLDDQRSLSERWHPMRIQWRMEDH